MLPVTRAYPEKIGMVTGSRRGDHRVHADKEESDGNGHTDPGCTRVAGGRTQGNPGRRGGVRADLLRRVRVDRDPPQPARRARLAQFTRFKTGELLSDDGVAGLVAHRAGDVLGSAFVDER